MEKNLKPNARQAAIKISLVAVITLLLLIPLSMIKGVIEDREENKKAVEEEVAHAYGKQQIVSAPLLLSYVTEDVEIAQANGEIEKKTYVKEYNNNRAAIDYKANVETDILHRSVYDVIVYNSKISISGKFTITEKAKEAQNHIFRFRVADQKGFNNPSQLTVGGQTFNISKKNDYYEAEVQIPTDIEAGSTVDFAFTFELKGTESLFFIPSNEGNTSLAISSSYPHPSFQGEMLPTHRDVRDDGFDATWNVSEYNSANNYSMGIKFVNPANPYQQSMRSAKYGILIVILVFVAGMIVEFLTRKEINPIQYAVIGLSLVLFYSLLIAFSEFITFGVSYMIAASMTTVALMLYYKGILKNRSAYMLGGFIALVYVLNYILLQMETYALLSGSLVLFLLLCAVMYLTTDFKFHKTE